MHSISRNRAKNGGWWLQGQPGIWVLRRLPGGPGRSHQPRAHHDTFIGIQDAQTTLAVRCCCLGFIFCVIPIVFVALIIWHCPFRWVLWEECHKTCFPLKKKKTLWLKMYIHESLCKHSREEGRNRIKSNHPVFWASVTVQDDIHWSACWAATPGTTLGSPKAVTWHIKAVPPPGSAPPPAARAPSHWRRGWRSNIPVTPF